MVELIKRIENEYKINVDDFLDLYRKGLSREEIAEELNIGVFKVRQISSLLNLRLKKKHRQADLELFEAKLKQDKGDTTYIEELTKDVELLNNELIKKNKALQKCKDDKLLLNRQVRELSRNSNFYDRLFNELKCEIDEIELCIDNLQKPIKNLNNNTIVVALADIHIGNLVKSEFVGWVNKYNFNIAKKRLQKVFNEVNKIDGKNLEIVLLGDILQGLIHQGNISGEMPVVKALVDFVKMFSKIVIPFKEKFEKINITITNGNHSRLTENVVFDYKTMNIIYLFEMHLIILF